MDLKNRNVIVTGAGMGIGRALALEFARNGARVVCCSRRKETLAETVALVEREKGTALAVPTDITQPREVQNLLDTTLKRFGPVDVLFNNAGSFQSIAGVHEANPEAWWHDITVNLYGSLLLIRGVLPSMIARNEGIIINMNGGRPVGGSAYGSSKAGLMELTRILHDELQILKSAVLVLSADPGLVRTEMTQLQVDTEAGRRWIPSTKECFESGKLRRPDEIAKATIRMIQAARPDFSGKRYNPDTDFSQFGREHT